MSTIQFYSNEVRETLNPLYTQPLSRDRIAVEHFWTTIPTLPSITFRVCHSPKAEERRILWVEMALFVSAIALTILCVGLLCSGHIALSLFAAVAGGFSLEDWGNRYFKAVLSHSE